MNKAMKIAATLAVSAFGFGAAAAGAQAAPTVGAPPSPGGAYTSNAVVTSANNSFTVSGAVVTCTTATFGSATSPITAPGAPNNYAQFRPVYTGCTLAIAGQTCAATVTVGGGPWRLHATTYVAGTGSGPGTVGASYRGTVELTGSMVNTGIDVTACGLSCHINVAAQTVTPTLPTGTLVATNQTATSVRISGVANNIAYQSLGCPGVATTGTNGIYTIPAGSPVNVNGIQVYGS